MKNPEEYLNKINSQTNYSILDAITEAQKESHNQAIEDSVKNSEGYYYFNQRIYRDGWYLDKDSILKLKIK